MTGQAQRYEPPLDPALVLRSAGEAADRVVALLMARICWPGRWQARGASTRP